MGEVDRNKWVRSNREATIQYSHVEEWLPGTLGYPSLELLSDLPSDNRIRSQVEREQPIWCLVESTQTGMDRTGASFSFFPTREDAERAMRPDGTSFDEEDFLKPLTRDFKVGTLSAVTMICVGGMRGEPPYELVYEALHGAGVYENFGLSQLVYDWLGTEGRDWLENEYGENWECVAILEYCTVHFPSSALVTLAARVLVADFVSDNGFDAGYASRELMMLASGTEQIAKSALNHKKKRAKGSAESNKKKKQERLEAHMSELEKLAPFYSSFSEERICEQAWDNLLRSRDDWPSTPKWREEYETLLRSDVALKARYNAVFRKNA